MKTIVKGINRLQKKPTGCLALLAAPYLFLLLTCSVLACSVLAYSLFIYSMLAYAPAAYAQDASLKSCQRWQDKIDHYQALRRKGGSAQQMNRWQQAKRKHKETFKHKRCKKYGRKLSR